ncbi:MAG: M28 family peptidase [Chitinophagales bacterium]
MFKLRFLMPAALAFTLSSCQWFNHQAPATPAETPTETPLAASPEFNADTAFAFVKAQTDFGPRTPNSAAHDKCATFIASTARRYADTVYIQSYTATGFDGKALASKNIIASFNPGVQPRVYVSAHWDTRPFADQDDNNKDQPIDGANDGGSGVAVMLEALRSMQAQRPDIGVDFIFFDSEDYGQPQSSTLPPVENSYCLGSQYWATHLHVPGYKADFGINLDMVGSADAVFLREQTSVSYADWASQFVWNVAGRLGFSSLFQNRIAPGVTDDHLYVNRLANIPSIDIIHYSENGFGSYWHTHRDNLQVISKETLRMVGKTVVQSIYQYSAEKKPATASK